MKQLIQLGLLFSLMLTMTKAHSALLIEPILGYNVGVKSEIDLGVLGKEKTSGGSGVGIGGRLGYQNLGFQLGLDFLKSTIDMNDSAYDEDLELTEWAGFVGFEFPILVRVYAGYIFSAEGKSENADQKYTFTEGTGTKLGVGFTGLPFVDINVEYRTGSFEKLKIGGTKASIDTDYSALFVGLSLPFNI